VPFVLALLVHRHVLGLFFSTDDLVQLQRSAGLEPQPPLLWRVLSLRLWDDALWRLFGSEPLGWHVCSLLAHAVNAALVGAWARRLGGTAPVAMVAAGAFAVTPLATSTVSQFATMSEMMALGLSLGALLALDARRPAWRWAGPALHAAALLAKENVLLVPLVALLRGAGERGERARPWAPLAAALAASAAMGAYVAMVLLRPGTGFLRADAYGFSLGPHVPSNLVAYASWSTCSFGGEPPGPPHAPGVRLLGIAAMVALAVSAWRPGARAVRAGLALWLLSLAPVLALRQQVYVHYVYVGFAGWAVAGAWFVHAMLARTPVVAGASPARRRAWGWGAAALALVSLALFAEMAWSVRAGTRVRALGLPRDSMLRRMEFAGNAWRGLRESLPSSATRLVVLNPPREGSVFNARTGERVADVPEGSPHYDMASALLLEGRVLRVLFPQLVDARIAQTFEPADSIACVAAVLTNGRVIAFGSGPDAHLALGRFWVEAGLAEDARVHLGRVAALHPGSADLALAHAVTGVADTAEAVQGLMAVLARFPGTPAAAQAADLLGRMGRSQGAARP
jgi:hypothetical protein